VESIVRDLADMAYKQVREQAKTHVRAQSAERAEERLLDALLPRRRGPGYPIDLGEAESGESDTRRKLRAQLRLRAQVDERFKECRAKVGELDIAAPPGSKVRLDDKVDLGRGPLTHTTFVAPGKHFVVAIWSDGQKAEDVSVEAGKTAKVDLLVASAGSGDGHGGHDVPPPATYRSVRPAAGWAIPFVLGGLAAGAFGVAVGFGLLSSGAASDAKMYAAFGPCGATGAWCGEGQAAAASANDKATVSAVFYVASGVLAAAAVTTFFAWPKTRIEVTPTMGPTGGGAVLRASF